MIAPDDQPWRIIVHAAVAHVQAINDGVAQWLAALDNSPAHAMNAASYLANVRSSFDLQITRAPWRSSRCCVGYTHSAFSNAALQIS